MENNKYTAIQNTDTEQVEDLQESHLHLPEFLIGSCQASLYGNNGRVAYSLTKLQTAVSKDREKIGHNQAWYLGKFALGLRVATKMIALEITHQVFEEHKWDSIAAKAYKDSLYEDLSRGMQAGLKALTSRG